MDAGSTHNHGNCEVCDQIEAEVARLTQENDEAQRDLDATREAATQERNEARSLIRCPDGRMTLMEAIGWLNADCDAAVKRAEAAEAELRDGDSWQQRATAFLEGGGCPICFASDEDGHKPGCLLGQAERERDAAVQAKEAAEGHIRNDHHRIEMLCTLLQEKRTKLEAAEARVGELVRELTVRKGCAELDGGTMQALRARVGEQGDENAALRARLAVVSSTYGDLPAHVQRMIEPHIWDNMTASEQRDWLLARLAVGKEMAARLTHTDKCRDAWAAADNLCALGRGPQPRCTCGRDDLVRRWEEGR